MPNPYIVYPASSKFESITYEFSYYQLYMYFKNKISEKNSQLIIFGFSLKDEHISEEIKKIDSGLNVLVFCYKQSEWKELLKNYPLYTYVHPKEENENITCLEWMEYLVTIINSDNSSQDMLNVINKNRSDNEQLQEFNISEEKEENEE